MRLDLRLVIILGLGLIWFTPLARAEKPLEFTTACLELKNTEVNKLVIRDLDKDGQDEIVIQSGRRLTVYQVRPPAFEQVTSFELPAEIWLYDFASLPGETGLSLVGVTAEAVLAIPFRNKSLSPTARILFQTKTLFEGQPDTPPLFRTFCYGTYLIVPGAMKFVIAQTKTNGEVEVIQEIPVRMDCRVKTGDNATDLVESCVRLPILYFTDISQDKRPDLVFYQDNFLSIYEQDEQGKFVRSGADIDVSLSRRKHRKEGDLSYEILPVIRDINGDGRPDVLVSNGSKGICGVYLNHPEAASVFQDKQPDYIKRIKGWLINHELTDLNNDGLADLVLVVMPKVGIMSGLRLLVAQSINWQIQVYGALSDKVYPDSPHYQREISVPFTLSLGSSDVKMQTPYLISFTGDFNRDGLNDMVLKEKDQKALKIYPGRSKKMLSSKPAVSLALTSPADFTPRGVLYGIPEIRDFNQDGTEDILIHQEDFSGRHHFIEVFLTKCPK